MSEWQLGGENASGHPMMHKAISLAKELNDMNSLANALNFAAAAARDNPAAVDRLASELIELSTRHSFSHWLTMGTLHRGWARSASGDTAEGIPWIEQGIRELRATGSVISLPYWLSVKAEVLHFADRTSEALEAISEAEALAEGIEQHNLDSAIRLLRGVFLANLGGEETEIEGSFRAAIRIAKEQKSVSQEKRAEATYAEYRRQKVSGSEGRGFRLPLC